MLFPIIIAEAASGGGFTADQVATLLVAVVVALGGGGLIGRKVGKREALAARLEEPVPTVPTQNVPRPVTYDQHSALERRVRVVEADLKDLRDSNSREYKQLLEAGSAREERIMGKLDELISAVHQRIDKLVDRKGGPR